MTPNKGYPQEFIDKVRAANNIVDIARSYMPLKQKGQDFWACCPFHSEKTPSFKVSNANQFYYCFGCHASGNIFSLVMKMENLSWHEALEFLAKKANLELPQTADNGAWLKARQKKERIYQALLLARDFYCRNLYLPQNQAALQYLHQRGIDDACIKMFHIGYSDSWGGVVDELKRHGISEQTMKDAGIVASNDRGRVWDAQFERVVFSIHDVYGNCIGFTGRTMKSDVNLAKYKNTAETLVFNKSNIVYGVDVMKEKTRGQRIDGLIVVEGNVDEIMMIKHGFVNTVACMGTALTKFHAGIMARFGKVVYLCLDGDNAGEHATLKSIDVLQEAGLMVRVIALPDKQDPDEFLKAHGAAAMQEYIKNSMGGLEFKLYYAKKHSDLTDKLGKTAYLNEVVAILAQIESPAERELYLPDIANTVGIGVEAIRNTINARVVKTPIKADNTISSGKTTDNNHNMAKNASLGKVAKAEAVVAAAVLHDCPYAKFDVNDLPEFGDKVYQKIVTQGLKLCDIDDKLAPEELQHSKPLIAKEFNLSEKDQIKEWQDCLNCLKIQKLKQRREQEHDIKVIEQITQQIKVLEQKQKVED